MTAPVSGRAAAFLRRTVLLAGMLAIIAGILGMHIMTGSHSMPAAAAVPGADLMQTMDAPGTGHTTHSARATSATDSSPSVPGTSMHGSWCADPDGCAMMSAMNASCTLSPGSPPPAAPPPGNTPFAAHLDADAPPQASTYSYLPGSPSPGQLCISRT